MMDVRLPSTELVSSARPVPASSGAYNGPAVIDAEAIDPRRRTLRDHLRALERYRWLGLTCFGAVLALATLAALLAPRLYSASTRLQVTRQSQIQLRLDENVLRLDDGDRPANATSSFVATQVAALNSRDLAERVISRHHLADNEAFLRPGPMQAGLSGLGGRIMSVLRPRGWEGAVGPAADTAAGDISGSRARILPPLLDRYMRYLDVQDVHGTDLVEIRFTTPDPRLSAFLAAAHTQAYVEANDEARLATNITAKDFLGRQLHEARERVEQAQAALSNFAAAHPNVAVNQEQALIVQRIAELSTLLTKAEGSRVAFETRYEFLTRDDADPLSYFLDRAGIQKLHQALLDLQAQRAALAPRLGPNHPQMLQLVQQAREVEQQLSSEVAREMAAVSGHYNATRLREDRLRHKLEQQEEAATDLRDLGAHYDRLKVDLQTAQALSDSLLKQQIETEVNAQLAASNIRVVERPEVPDHPTRPNVPLLLTLGMVCGTGLGIAVCLLCEHLDTSLKSDEEAEVVLHLPVLATILRHQGTPAAGLNGAAPGTGAELAVLRAPGSATAEGFRRLGTAVSCAPPAPPKIILVTSAVAGEGKTVTCLNLATALAESGARVLLLDADLRHPGCHQRLDAPNERGLSTLLAGDDDPAGIVQTLETPRLSFIPAGPIPANPAALIGSTRLHECLAELSDAYDFLVLDSPPVLPVRDAVVLGREADGVVLVLRGQDTPREAIRRARDLLLQANTNLLGVVVNNVDHDWSGPHVYYGYEAVAPLGEPVPMAGTA